MPVIDADGRSLYVESFGDPEDPALLLISGITSQLTSWAVEFCESFVDRGFFVIRFDNRDVGFSKIYASESRYTLSDMADDCVEVLAHFDVSAAHVMGISLGGMVAQTLTIDHPNAVLSLISYASTTGNPEFGAPTHEALETLLLPEVTSRAEAEERGVLSKSVWGTAGTWDEDEWAMFSGDNYDRSHPEGGGERQYMAVLDSGDREAALSTVATPTLVIHGTADPLIGVDAGRRTAEVIPGAIYLEIEDMGHDIPMREWPQIVTAITSLASTATVAQ